MATSTNLLTVPQAAERLGLRPATVRSWILFRKIERVRLSPRAVRIAESELSRIIAERTVPRLEPRPKV